MNWLVTNIVIPSQMAHVQCFAFKNAAHVDGYLFVSAVPGGLTECPMGRYGANCDQTCSDNCRGENGNNFCYQYTGVCYDGQELSKYNFCFRSHWQTNVARSDGLFIRLKKITIVMFSMHTSLHGPFWVFVEEQSNVSSRAIVCWADKLSFEDFFFSINKMLKVSK